MAGIHVVPDTLTGSAKLLRDAGTDFGEKLAAFQAELAAFGEPWGGDDLGSLVGIAYGVVSEFAFECYSEALEELDLAGGDVDVMADRYRAVESAAAEHFDGMMR